MSKGEKLTVPPGLVGINDEGLNLHKGPSDESWIVASVVVPEILVWIQSF